MKISSVSNVSYANSAQTVAFAQKPLCENTDNFEKQNCQSNISEIKISVPVSSLDFTQSAKEHRQKQVELARKSAIKVNNYLKEKGYEPCDKFIISGFAVNPAMRKKAGARYLQNLNAIALAPFMLDEFGEDACEMFILHEQGHYLHQQKMKKLGLSFKPKQLTDDEKACVREAYKKILKDNYDKEAELYFENSLEFVGWYFTFKNRGNDFGEDVDKIYQKYYGP